MRFAAFISPHGFGHAARSSAVLAEVNRRAGATFELFTTAPRWFFEESLAGTFRYHEVLVDVGFRQESALEFDLNGTVTALESLVPFDEERVAALAALVRGTGCDAVLCDIAPLGIAVADAAGLPSVLVENFSWSWLYEPLFEVAPDLRAISSEFDRWVARATVHVQAQPVCERSDGCELVDPISREARLDRAAARIALDIDGARPVVLVTMGGYGEPMPFLSRLRELSNVTFVITGAAQSGRDGNLHLFDNNTPLFMPDVMRAADALVAKLGYGTVSEAWREGIPFAHVTRPDSREMASLETFVHDQLAGFLVTRREFTQGKWIDRLPELLALPRRPRPGGGAARVAEILLDLV